MKKKHLRALSSVETWLSKQDLLNEELKSAILILRSAVESGEETEIEIEVLPRPKEIEGEINTFALYSDGGCRGNPGPGAYAYVVQDVEGKVLLEGVEFESHTTNNKMELSAPLRGLVEMRDVLREMSLDPLLTRIKVITDSKYVVDGMKSWVQGWKSRGWKKADGKAPENLDLWKELDHIRNSYLEVKWEWVKGHGGHPQNEYCDKKANQAMDANIR